MTPQEAATAHENRIAELATGFALNDLSEAELRELHNALLDPAHGLAAARSAWRTLETVTDLRAERSSSLQDTVRLRLEEQAHELRGTSVTGRFLRRIGLRRGGLIPIESSTLAQRTAQRTPSRWWILGVCCSFVVILAGVGWFMRAAPVAHVVSVIGRASVGTTTLGPGDLLDGRPLSAATDATVTLRWANGSEAFLSGPGTLIPSRDGAALLGGVLQVAAHGQFALGLPDGQALASAGTDFTAEVGDGRSVLGCRSGVLDATGGPLSAGFARAAGATFSWQQQTWNRLPAELPIGGVAAWTLTIEVAPQGDERVIMSWNGATLTVDALSVTLARPEVPVVRAVRPPTGARLECSAQPGKWVVRLHDEELLRSTNAPQWMTTITSGSVSLVADFTSGPRPRDERPPSP